MALCTRVETATYATHQPTGAYSTDLREKIVLAHERGEGTFDELAETFGVARWTA